MLLMNFDVVIIKNMKMPSYSRHLCLYILLLLFSVVITFANGNDQSVSLSSGNGGIGADHINRPNYIQLNTKNNNRDLSEISVRKPQHHHHHHQHHFRHQNSHNNDHRSRSSGNHQKQHNHQSNDSAVLRVPDYQRQSISLKKHLSFDDGNAAGGGGFHMRNHAMHQHHHHQQNRLTTMGPFRSRINNRGSSWSTSGETNKKYWSDNLSRNRQAPLELSHSLISRKPYTRPQHTIKRSTTTTTTTTDTPDEQEKVFFDAQNSFNNIDSNDDTAATDDDDFDYNFDDEYSAENVDTKKRSPNSGTFERHHKTNQQSNENFQRDDPVRSSIGYNGITTTTFKSQHSSNNDNYQLNVNNDGSMNDRPTIETSKSFVEQNSMMRNIQSRNRNEPGALTREKFEKLGTATAVEQTFRQQLPEQELRRLAYAHSTRVSREGFCKWPKPKLIPVPHHTSKTYTPHCTILHRCSDETGCCHVDYKTCQPLRKENVTLAFWTQQHSRGNVFVEMLTFENHTECGCIERSSLSNDDPLTTLVATLNDRCRCPKHFTNVIPSQCKCDCTSKQPNNLCNKLKAGQEHFSISERRCIISESCERPTCTHGEYDSKTGHCPRQDEALTFPTNTLNDD